MFTPLFALGFPVLGAAPLTPGEAVATALIIESVGYSSGLFGHARQQTVVWSQVRSLAVVAAPAAAVAATLAHRVPGHYLLLGVAATLFSLGVLIMRATAVESGGRQGSGSTANLAPDESTVVRASDGRMYRCASDRRPAVARLLTSLAAGLTGLVGISIGEVTSTRLMLRLQWPARVAVGTSVGVVLPTVVTAGMIQAALLNRTGLGIRWNLLLWTVPAVLIGGQVAPQVTRLVPERRLKHGIAALFLMLAIIIAVSTSLRLAT